MYPIAEVNKMDVVFGCNALNIMPKYEDIPDEFKNHNKPTKWNQLITEWFFCGLSKLKATPKEGVDEKKALAHIRSIFGSFEPKHEHKEAAAAFLMSEWFDDVEWEKAKK